MKSILIVFLFITLAASSALAGTVTKSPDQGAYWNPLSNGGTYIYANSFVAPDSGVVTSLGLWLLNVGPGLYYQVFDSIGGNPSNGPDSTDVLATTALQTGMGSGVLTLYTAPAVAGGTPLVAGQTYWFAANAVGTPGSGSYTVGGHTQNSVYADNGTFWYSNDALGLNFDGQGLTPEMAFTVSTAAVVPEPGTLALFGLGLGGLGLLGARRRRKKRN